jgi:hypothetical protein
MLTTHPHASLQPSEIGQGLVDVPTVSTKPPKKAAAVGRADLARARR